MFSDFRVWCYVWFRFKTIHTWSQLRHQIGDWKCIWFEYQIKTCNWCYFIIEFKPWMKAWICRNAKTIIILMDFYWEKITELKKLEKTLELDRLRNFAEVQIKTDF